MKNLLLICSFVIASFTNAMPSEKDVLDKSFGGPKNLRHISTMRYNVKDYNLSFVQIKDWDVFDVQNKIVWHEYCFRNPKCKDKKPRDHQHIRADMKPRFIMKILQDSFNTQNIEYVPGHITIHKSYHNYQRFDFNN